MIDIFSGPLPYKIWKGILRDLIRERKRLGGIGGLRFLYKLPLFSDVSVRLLVPLSFHLSPYVEE